MTGSTPRLLAAVLLLCGAAAAHADGATLAGRVEVTPAKYLEETVVYLKLAPGTVAPQRRSLDQQHMAFVPHLLVVNVGDTVRFLNHDAVVHNVYSPDAEGYNLGSFKQDEDRSHTFARPGAYTQLCSVHPEMLGYVFVSPSPYAAAVDKKGGYAIHGIPPGTYQLAVWNAHLPGPERSVTISAGRTTTENLTVRR